MQNISVDGVCQAHDYDRKIDLRNGTLIIHLSGRDCVKGAYIVTSFRDGRNRYKGDQTSTYCSLINLDDGTLCFEERCSRSTTEKRILSHLNRNFYGEGAATEGQKLQIYKNGDFKLNIRTILESFK